jgi:hypothetical protein
MEGIQFVVDSDGKKTAVVIDLARYGELLEEFFDVAVSEHRLDTETCVPFEDVVKQVEEDRARSAEDAHAATV